MITTQNSSFRVVGDDDRRMAVMEDGNQQTTAVDGD